MLKNSFLDPIQKRVNSEESSEFNSLFIINSDFNEILDLDQESLNPHQDPCVETPPNNLVPRDYKSFSYANSFISSSELHKFEAFSPKKIVLKKHNNYTNNLIENQINYHQVENKKEGSEKEIFKEIDKEPQSEFKEQNSERYKFVDSNEMLKNLKKSLQRKQKTTPVIKFKPNAAKCVENPNKSVAYSEEINDKIPFPKKKDAFSEEICDSLIVKITDGKFLQSQSKDSSEKTQEDTNFEKNLKDSATLSNAEFPKDEKIHIENLERINPDELEGLEVYFETHQQLLCTMKLPINKDFLVKKPENEVLWNNCFEIITENNDFFMIVKILIGKDAINPLEMNVRNVTESVKKKMKYDWHFGKIVDSNLFNGVMLQAFDQISQLNFNVLSMNYEKLGLLQLYEDLYKVLLLYYLSVKNEKNSSIINISDIYITEYVDLIENSKKFLLWVIFEPFSMQMSQIIEIRQQKNLHYSAQELLYIYKEFATDLFSLNEFYGFSYPFSENRIYFASAENCLKVIDLGFFFQIKNKMPHALSSLNNFMQNVRNITDFNEDFRIEAYVQSLHCTHLDKTLKELTVFSPLKRNFEGIVAGFMNELLKSEFLEEETLLLQAKIQKKCYYYKNSNENYKKLGMKYQMDGKNDLEIKYKIGKNFFWMGSFEKAKGLLGFVKENFVKDMEKQHKKVLVISLMFAFICESEKDLEGSSKIFEELLKENKKYEKFGPKLKLNLIKYLAFINRNLANNLSHLKKSSKLYNDVMSLMEKSELDDETINSLGILNASLGNYDQSLNFFKRIYMVKTKDFLKDSLKDSKESVKDSARDSKEPFKDSKELKDSSVHLKNKNELKEELTDSNDINDSKKKDLNDSNEKKFSKDVKTIEKQIMLLSNMSLVYIETKNYTEAKRLLYEAKDLLNQNNEIKAKLKINILMHSGVLHDKMNDFYEALKDFKSALHAFKQAFPVIKELEADYKRLLFAILCNMAGVYLKFGDYEKSNGYLEKCEKLLCEFDPGKEKISASYLAHNKGVLCQNMGKMDEAVKYVDNSLKIKRKFFEENNYNISNTMKLLFKLHLLNNNREKAVENSQKFIEIMKKMCNKNPKELFIVLEEIAENYKENNAILEAIDVYNEALGFINSEEITDSKRIEFYNKLSSLYENIKNWEKNMEICERLVEIYKKNQEENVRILINLHVKIIEDCKKTKKDESLKKFLSELESLKVIENNKNLLKKVGGKLLVSLKGVKTPKKVNPFPNK